MIRPSALPVLSVNAWSRTYVDDRNAVQPAPKLTWRDRRLIEQLQASGKLEIRELRTGIEFVTRSHVGFVPFEHFALRIHPAISHADMLRMMHYAYDMDDLTVYERTGMSDAMEFALEELVIAGLAFHVRTLARQRLFQAYVEQDAELATVRGSVRFGELATRYQTGVSLPCRYERRTVDVLPNQLLAGGLMLAQHLTANRKLRQEMARLRTFLEEHVTPRPLSEDAFRTAEREMTRLNAHYRPALDLCHLLFQNASLGEAVEGKRHFPGFLLDMNHLFERFIGRLLGQVVPDGFRVDRQRRRSFYTAPPGQRVPQLRPDFRVVDAEGEVIAILDAKYKFLDSRPIDVSDLYQLTIYGIAEEPTRGSVIALYPGIPTTETSTNFDGSHNVSDRIYQFEGPNQRKLNVVFRRVRLNRVWEALLSPDGRAELYEELLGT